jgi:hypothetical protein
MRNGLLRATVLLVGLAAAPVTRADTPPTGPLTLALDQGRFWYAVRVSVLRGSRVVRRLTARGRAGLNAARLQSLSRGPYRVTLVATDAAGNAAEGVVTRVRPR